MTDPTPLDEAHAAMQADPANDEARLAFYERLAGSELFLMLKEEPKDDAESVSPELFEFEEASFVLVFDREERLVAFTGVSTPYVALSGRAVSGMLEGQGIGLGFNLDVAPSAILLPPEAVTWLNDTLGNAPNPVNARISTLHPPTGLPEQLVTSLDARLASAMGLATSAYLAGVTYEDGARGHLLGFVDAMPNAQDALAQFAAEALTFSGIEAGAMDIAFFQMSDPVTERLGRVGLRFDLPSMQETVTQSRPAPGMDPENPPKLK